MIDPDLRFNQMILALRAKHFRLTPQRVELLRLIAVSEGHPSAAQLHAKIQQRFPTMSHATVYKTLALLKQIDQVLEIDLRDDSHYDGNRPEPHPHLICVQCSKIIDAEVSLDKDSIQNLEQISGYQILRPQITLYGLCSECKKEGKTQ